MDTAFGATHPKPEKDLCIDYKSGLILLHFLQKEKPDLRVPELAKHLRYLYVTT